MLRSMYSGISGLRGFQTKLDVIGNNIANVNTFGYKKSRVTFKDMISQQIQGASSPQQNRGGTNPKQVGLGSQLSTIDTIHSPGSTQSTSRSLDLAISGDGFFIVNDGALSYYTRAGNFYLDHHGNLVTADGYYVQGYAANELGQIDYTQLSNLRIASGATIAPNPTTQITFKGNLHAGTEAADSSLEFTDGDSYQIAELKQNLKYGVMLPIRVVDSVGYTHELNIIAQKVEIPANTPPLNPGTDPIFGWELGYLTPDTNNSGQFVYNTLNETILFNTDGKVDNTSDLNNITLTIEPSELSFNYGGNASTLNITLDFSGLSEYGSANSFAVDTMDGNAEGFLEGFDVSATGEIFGIYSNGNVQPLGQIALAAFSNAEGLTRAGNNLFQVSNNSGVPQVGLPGDVAGDIVGGALEMSNVDLAEEFTEMIVAQRGFQANTRIITTSDEILQELVNLKR